MARIPLDDALDMYGIPHWGGGYFGISPGGELTVRPTREPGREFVLSAVLAELRRRGVDTPLVFRFPQILASRVEDLAGAFGAAISEFDYRADGYLPVFPIKVNQRRGMVEALLAAGRPHRLGLEVGSRAELMAALALDLADDALIIVNGYKDEHTMSLALLGARIGRRVVVVIEKMFEVELVIRMLRSAREAPLPDVGFRARLFARGSGKWWKSSGTTAKFGLTTAGLIEGVNAFKTAGMLDRLTMLHFHIGSQIPEIRRLKAAFREGARIYAKLYQQGAPIKYFNVGGGLAVDYDGSKTASDASMNYSIAEYANDVVYMVREICDEEAVAQPTLVSESGRALAAYHSVLVSEVLGRISADPPLPDGTVDVAAAPRVLRELVALRDEIGGKTYREYYHDAVEHRDELATMFNIGLISLKERALAEQMFWEIARRALSYAKREKIPLEEFEQLERALQEKYILNFSVFQSAPDHWALEQLFPIVPLTRLTEPPTHRATLVDITCDSDGEIDHFVDIKDVKESIALHDPAGRPGEPYDIAILLLGAYQDVMGDMHNLFGTPDDAYVVIGEDGKPKIVKVVRGDSASDVLEMVGYDEGELVNSVEKRLDALNASGALDSATSRALLDDYRSLFRKGTYLESRKLPIKPAGAAAEPTAAEQERAARSDLGRGPAG